MSSANPYRGEAAWRVSGVAMVLRPSFSALVAVEAEIGPLLALVERAADGRMSLNEIAALIWHCIEARPEGLTREAVGESVVASGLAAAMPVLRQILGQILRGQ